MLNYVLHSYLGRYSYHLKADSKSTMWIAEQKLAFPCTLRDGGFKPNSARGCERTGCKGGFNKHSKGKLADSKRKNVDTLIED